MEDDEGGRRPRELPVGSRTARGGHRLTRWSRRAVSGTTRPQMGAGRHLLRETVQHRGAHVGCPPAVACGCQFHLSDEPQCG